MKINFEKDEIFLSGLFLIGRFILLLSLPYEGLLGYGDLLHYYRVAALGNPMINIWIEYPPIFAYLARGLYLLVGGRENTFVYSLVLFFSILQAAGFFIFLKLYKKIKSDNNNLKLPLIYFVLLLIIPHGWWQFDVLVVFIMLLGLWLFSEKRYCLTTSVVSIGILMKLFPLFLLPIIAKQRSFGKAVILLFMVIVILSAVLLGFYLASPDMTIASLKSQWQKGSWETIWALIDGNLTTGSFGPLADRFNPELVNKHIGYTPKISPFYTLIIFTLFGLFIFFKFDIQDLRSSIIFLMITWCIFLLWSPGWSPQWILYLLPLIFLVLTEHEAILIALSLVAINLLEWPIFLSRGYSWGLWLTVSIRTFLFILILVSLLWDNRNYLLKPREVL